MAKKGFSNWLSLLFDNQRYHFPGILSGVFLYSLMVTLIILLEQWFKIFEKLNVPGIFHTVLGLVLGLLLVFRTNTAYDRWWEGRKLLGDLTNTIRSLAIKINTFIDDENLAFKMELKSIIKSFSWTLKNHLRDEAYLAEENPLPKEYVNYFNTTPHKPNYLINLMNSKIAKLYNNNNNTVINNEKFKFIEEDIFNLTKIVGGCERIKNTPIPLGYSLHLRRILVLYLFTLPFGIVTVLGWWSIVICAILFYTMVGIEILGAEIENPFGVDFNDLPFDTIDKNLKENVEQIFLLKEH